MTRFSKAELKYLADKTPAPESHINQLCVHEPSPGHASSKADPLERSAAVRCVCLAGIVRGSGRHRP
jgi:hypothetical protein